MPATPAGEDKNEFTIKRIRDWAKRCGLQPAQARKIYRDFSLDSGVLMRGVERTDPNFNELKAQLARQYDSQIDASVLEVFPED